MTKKEIRKKKRELNRIFAIPHIIESVYLALYVIFSCIYVRHYIDMNTERPLNEKVIYSIMLAFPIFLYFLFACACFEKIEGKLGKKVFYHKGYGGECGALFGCVFIISIIALLLNLGNPVLWDVGYNSRYSRQTDFAKILYWTLALSSAIVPFICAVIYGIYFSLKKSSAMNKAKILADEIDALGGNLEVEYPIFMFLKWLWKKINEHGSNDSYSSSAVLPTTEEKLLDEVKELNDQLKDLKDELDRYK
ncbi:MAG: hypothetical protein J6D11_08220 [Clostridia bacterium]|nr:hypothetical protein [Clostridia bacterium]